MFQKYLLLSVLTAPLCSPTLSQLIAICNHCPALKIKHLPCNWTQCDQLLILGGRTMAFQVIFRLFSNFYIYQKKRNPLQ